MTPAELRVGDTCVIDVKVENVSDKVTHVYYMTIYQATPLVIADSEGKAVKSRQTGDYGWPHPKEFFHLIKPGDTFATQIKGRVSVKWARAGELPADPAKRDVALLSQDMAYGLGRPGKFTAQLHLIADDRRVAEGKRYGIDPVWTGEMHSNTVAFSVRHMTREELDGFIETLRTGAEEQRREAIRVLAAHGDRQAVPALLDILNKGPGPLQRPVADALGGIQDTSVVPDLLAFYKRFADRGDRASGEFKQCVLQAWSVLEPDKQKRAELFVGVLKSDAAVESRKYAAWNLVYLKHPQRIPTLLAAARDGDRRMQWAAIDVLGSVARETPGEARAQIATALVEILKSAPDRTVRSRAAGALRNVADKSVVPAPSWRGRTPSQCSSSSRRARSARVRPMRRSGRSGASSNDTVDGAGAMPARAVATMSLRACLALLVFAPLRRQTVVPKTNGVASTRSHSRVPSLRIAGRGMWAPFGSEATGGGAVAAVDSAREGLRSDGRTAMMPTAGGEWSCRAGVTGKASASRPESSSP